MQIADEFLNASSVNLVNKCRKCFFFRYNILDNCWSIVLRSKLINKVQTVLYLSHGKTKWKEVSFIFLLKVTLK